jgi:hypothetical protein
MAGGEREERKSEISSIEDLNKYLNAYLQLLFLNELRNIYREGFDKIMQTLQVLYTFLYYNMVMDHLLLSIQRQSFLEWTRTYFEQS